jgi:hypothetical protein
MPIRVAVHVMPVCPGIGLPLKFQVFPVTLLDSMVTPSPSQIVVGPPTVIKGCVPVPVVMVTEGAVAEQPFVEVMVTA